MTATIFLSFSCFYRPKMALSLSVKTRFDSKWKGKQLVLLCVRLCYLDVYIDFPSAQHSASIVVITRMTIITTKVFLEEHTHSLTIFIKRHHHFHPLSVKQPELKYYPISYCSLFLVTFLSPWQDFPLFLPLN